MFVPRERSKIISDQILNAPGDASHRGRAEGSTTEPDEAVYRVSTLDVKWDQRHKKNTMLATNLSVDGSVRVPMKGVPSCDMLRVGAGSL
jgi:hypothetical protein